MKKMFVFDILVIGVMAIGLFSSCKYAEIIDFVHEDTVDLPNKPALSDAILAPYRVCGVVFAPRVTHLDYQTSKIDLLVYGESNVNGVAVTAAVLRANKGKDLANMQSRQNVAMYADAAQPGSFVGRVNIIERVQDADLQAASVSNTISLDVVVEVGQTKQQLIYRFCRRSRKYMIQR